MPPKEQYDNQCNNINYANNDEDNNEDSNEDNNNSDGENSDDMNVAKCINYERMKFADDLVKMGHKCVTIKEAYRIQIIWCHNESCNDKGIRKMNNYKNIL